MGMPMQIPVGTMGSLGMSMHVPMSLPMQLGGLLPGVPASAQAAQAAGAVADKLLQAVSQGVPPSSFAPPVQAIFPQVSSTDASISAGARPKGYFPNPAQ